MHHRAESCEDFLFSIESCEDFLFSIKAGPAGGRLRRPSSAGNTMDEPSEDQTVAERVEPVLVAPPSPAK